MSKNAAGAQVADEIRKKLKNDKITMFNKIVKIN
jgi:uncharacterized protein YoaH (UPF0181 family)